MYELTSVTILKCLRQLPYKEKKLSVLLALEVQRLGVYDVSVLVRRREKREEEERRKERGGRREKTGKRGEERAERTCVGRPNSL